MNTGAMQKKCTRQLRTILQVIPFLVMQQLIPNKYPSKASKEDQTTMSSPQTKRFILNFVGRIAENSDF
jgi:hypothetical protein